MNNTNNPLTEVGIIVISVALIAAATVLLVLNKIDFTAATLMLGLVAGLFGIQGALKAPSPAQQENLKQLTSQVLSVLPTVVAATQQPAGTAAQPVQVIPSSPNNATGAVTTQFVQSPLAAIAPTGQMPAVVVPPETK